jgi:hypothetical protein
MAEFKVPSDSKSLIWLNRAFPTSFSASIDKA